MDNPVLNVIGGRNWKIRYIEKKGYIITMMGPNRDVPRKNQYNMETGKWTDYHPGEKNKQYNRGRCHTTGYSKEGHQESVSGITWGKKEGTSNKILNWGIVSGIIKRSLC